MNNLFEKPGNQLEKAVQTVFTNYQDDLHKLGLGEVAGEQEREFDWENYGLDFSKTEKQRNEFEFNFDFAKIKKIISLLEETLKNNNESAWQMSERNNGELLKSCFSGLEYLDDDPKQAFATLVYRLTKNHPLEDGNKRISSVVFVLGLLENNMPIEEIKQKVDLEEFGMVMSQLADSQADEAREKISNFLTNCGYK